MKPALVFSCEHGGNRVPARYRGAFARAAGALRSHRGWDPGSLQLARWLARELDAPLFPCTTTRLLADTNRSLGHPRLFSEWTRDLAPGERGAIVDRWWRPHRHAVEQAIRALAKSQRPVLHLSVHSFTPLWKGRRRTVDVALLYDPARTRERAFAADWLEALQHRRGDLRLRRNHPYRGTADGFTTHLRRQLSGRLYAGLELEVSQRFVLGSSARWRGLQKDLSRTLEEALASGSAFHRASK